MNGWNYLTVLTFLVVAALAGVGFMAYRGDMWAGVVLGALAAVVLVAAGWLMAMAQATFHERAKHRAFQENADENLALMNSQFKALTSMAQAQGRVTLDIQRENSDLRRALGDGGRPEPNYLEFDDTAMSQVLANLD